MSDIFRQIMINAVKIRLQKGEDLEEILNSYPKLTGTDKEAIRKVVNNG